MGYAIHFVVVYESGIAATIDDASDIVAWIECDIFTTVGYVRYRNFPNFGNAVDGSFAVSSGCEGSRYNVSGICPDSFMTSTIGVGETVGDSSSTIYNVDESVEDGGCNRVSTFVKDIRWRCARGIGRTGNGVGPVVGNVC